MAFLFLDFCKFISDFLKEHAICTIGFIAKLYLKCRIEHCRIDLALRKVQASERSSCLKKIEYDYEEDERGILSPVYEVTFKHDPMQYHKRVVLTGSCKDVLDSLEVYYGK